MLTALTTALTALTADSTAVDVVGNNLANLDTTGFKASNVSFHDLVDQAVSGVAQPGFGVTAPGIVQVYSQGTPQPTNSPYDAAIQGNGFFVVNDQNNNQLFTRDGSFSVDNTGALVTSSGDHVQGWSSSTGNVDTTNPIGNIVVPNAGINQPVSTANISMQVNLDASQAVGTAGASFSQPIQVYDSLGESHTVTMNFTKTAANTWTYTASVPGADLTAGTAGTPSQIATGTLTFDSQGNLMTPAPPPPVANASIALPIKGLADGAADLNINYAVWNTTGTTPVSKFTQVANPSSADAATQDGLPAAQVTTVSIGAHGQITASYTSGQPRVIGQLALATVINPDSLAGVGNGNLQATTATSLPSIGVPNTGNRGDVLGSSLEASTVDIAGQFTNLIVYQRSYEASAKVVTTANTLLQDTIALIV